MPCLQPYSYHLPPECIAQRPVVPRDAAKLLVVDRGTGALTECIFRDLTRFLTPNDIVVLNDTRVIPARMLAIIQGVEGEILLLTCKRQERTQAIWEALGRPMRRIQVGETIAIKADSERTKKKVTGKILSKKERTFEIELSSGEDSLSEALHEIGIMPIPPYIRHGQGDRQDVEDYQTLFARESGSVAAPTASLHFTKELLQEIRSVCSVLTLTLHVGQASFTQVFRPGEQEIILPGQERFSCSEETRLEIQAGKKIGKRVMAIGTTCTRALETICTTDELSGETSLFIQPGYSFNAIDSLVTNFHQPGTTHLLLVEALMGRELLEASYRYALSHDFRFLSYGDAMLIL